MSSTANRTICVSCNKEKITYPCQGCSQKFCLDDLTKHRMNLNQELEQVHNDHDELRQNLYDLTSSPTKHSFIQQIDQWEKASIEKIQQTAQQCRDQWSNYSEKFLQEMEKKLNEFAQQIKEMQRENEFNEIDLNHLKERSDKLQKELHRPTNVSIEQESTSFINKISLRISLKRGKNEHMETNSIIIF